MKKLIILACGIFAAVAAMATIITRDVTFSADEIPATNPRIERRGDIVTHIEVFGTFAELPDGGVKAMVAESNIDMDVVTAGVWIKEARKVVRGSVCTFSKIRLKIAIAQLGKLAELETWLASFEVAPGYSALEAWNDAQVISDDFEGFAQYFAAAKQILGVSDAQAEAILAQCVTTE